MDVKTRTQTCFSMEFKPFFSFFVRQRHSDFVAVLTFLTCEYHAAVYGVPHYNGTVLMGHGTTDTASITGQLYYTGILASATAAICTVCVFKKPSRVPCTRHGVQRCVGITLASAGVGPPPRPPQDGSRSSGARGARGDLTTSAGGRTGRADVVRTRNVGRQGQLFLRRARVRRLGRSRERRARGLTEEGGGHHYRSLSLRCSVAHKRSTLSRVAVARQGTFCSKLGCHTQHRAA